MIVFLSVIFYILYDIRDERLDYIITFMPISLAYIIAALLFSVAINYLRFLTHRVASLQSTAAVPCFLCRKKLTSCNCCGAKGSKLRCSTFSQVP